MKLLVMIFGLLVTVMAYPLGLEDNIVGDIEVEKVGREYVVSFSKEGEEKIKKLCLEANEEKNGSNENRR